MKTKEFSGLKENNKGQMAIEAVLLMTVLVGAFMFLSNEIKKRQLVSKMVQEPMRNVAAMAAFGTWKADGCTAPGKSRVSIGKCHPNSMSRAQSSDPKPQ